MNRSIIMRNANKLVKNGYSRSEALKRAWALAKLPEITVKVKGTAAVKSRQKALEHLTQYSVSDISFRVATETNNPVDKNAVAVIASVKNKGAYVIGYLPKALAADISPMLTAGITAMTTGNVTGGYYSYMNYGAKITLKFA